MNQACRLFVPVGLVVLLSPAIAQATLAAGPQLSVRISGRVVLPGGQPVGFHVRMAEVAPDGLKDEVATQADGQKGLFTFIGKPGTTYRIYLGSMYKTPPRTVDTGAGDDVDIGDLVLEYCPPTAGYRIPPKPPVSPQLAGDLQLDQIYVEPQQPSPVRGGNSFFLSLPPSKFPESPNRVELPQCWSGPSLDRREEWERLPIVQFDHWLSIESFVGGRVKAIRVVGYNPALSPSEIKQEVRSVWLGQFWNVSSVIGWSEGNLWNIKASVEYEDGKRSSILMDGWIHVQVEDRDGKYWYIRLYPAVG